MWINCLTGVFVSAFSRIQSINDGLADHKTGGNTGILPIILIDF